MRTLTGNNILPERIAVDLNGRLVAGEQIIWVGRQFRVAVDDRGMCAVGIVLLVFATVIALASCAGRIVNDSIAESLNAYTKQLLVISACLAPASALLIAPIWTKHRTRYVITNRRVFVWPGRVLNGGPLYAITWSEMTGIQIKRERKGYGDIILLQEHAGSTDGTVVIEKGLFGVLEPQKVSRILIQAAGDRYTPPQPRL